MEQRQRGVLSVKSVQYTCQQVNLFSISFTLPAYFTLKVISDSTRRCLFWPHDVDQHCLFVIKAHRSPSETAVCVGDNVVESDVCSHHFLWALEADAEQRLSLSVSECWLAVCLLLWVSDLCLSELTALTMPLSHVHTHMHRLEEPKPGPAIIDIHKSVFNAAHSRSCSECGGWIHVESQSGWHETRFI